MTCPSLARHLALVQPEATLGSFPVRIAAVAADFAASTLARRFAAPDSAGIDELVAAAAAGAVMSAEDVLLPLVRLQASLVPSSAGLQRAFLAECGTLPAQLNGVAVLLLQGRQAPKLPRRSRPCRTVP